MNSKAFALPEIGILIYITFQCTELFNAWLKTPLERYGWLIFVIWLLPLFFHYVRVFKGIVAHKASTPLILTALGLSLIGSLGTLNTLHYTGLAMALASFLPPSWRLISYVMSSVAWMPAFSWFVIKLNAEYLLPLRFACVSFGIIPYILQSFHETIAHER